MSEESPEQITPAKRRALNDVRAAVVGTRELYRALPFRVEGFDTASRVLADFLQEHTVYIAGRPRKFALADWTSIAELRKLEASLLGIRDTQHATSEGMFRLAVDIEQWLREEVPRVRRQLRRVNRDLVEEAEGRLAHIYDRLSVLAALRELGLSQSAVEDVVEEARETAEQLRAASGDVASSQLSAAFASQGGSHNRLANAWSWLVVVSLVGAASLAAYLVQNVRELSWSTEISKVAATLPILLLAGYAGRQATWHRQEANSAESVAVRLQTVQAYANAMTKIDDRDELLRAVGARVFSAATATEGAPLAPIGKDDAVTDSLSTLFEAIAKVVQRSGP